MFSCTYLLRLTNEHKSTQVSSILKKKGNSHFILRTACHARSRATTAVRGEQQIQDGHGIRNGSKYKRFQYDKKRLSFAMNSSSEFCNSQQGLSSAIIIIVQMYIIYKIIKVKLYVGTLLHQ